MAPKQKKTGTKPHAKRQQDDTVMECLIMLPSIGGAAYGVMGEKRQMVWEPLGAAVLQRLPAVNALMLESTPVCVRSGWEFHLIEGSGCVPSTQSRNAPENW
jgi:hypothetical protein